MERGLNLGLVGYLSSNGLMQIQNTMDEQCFLPRDALCDHIGWNSSETISPSVSLGRSLFTTPTCRVCSKGNTPKFGPKVTHPLLI